MINQWKLEMVRNYKEIVRAQNKEIPCKDKAVLESGAHDLQDLHEKNLARQKDSLMFKYW